MDKLIRFFRPQSPEKKDAASSAVDNTKQPETVLHEAIPQDARTLEELLGNTTAGAPDPRAHQRMYERPPHEETEAERNTIKARVDELDLEKLTVFIEQRLQKLLNPIARIEVPLRSIPTLYWTIEAISEKYFS